jgi:serine/threonine-protein kinase
MLAAGTQIGRYVVTRKLAEGGMAEIYLARAVGPEGFSKDVVIKVVRSFLATDQQFVDMFIAEARLASRLNHANVVQIFDFGKHEDTYYLAMEYVRGASLWDLRQRCRQQGVPFPATLAAEIGAQIARGLQYAHSLSDRGQKLGVVHRDVTPHNVLMSFDGAVKLTDFGIAKATTTHTAPGMLKGKFAYMSPEQARGEPVDARTDIFALGIVLWELLTGGRLFDGDSELAVLRAVEGSVIAPPARLNPDVPPGLSDLVMKALARPVDERFQTAFDLEKALATWVLHTAQSVEDTSVALFLQQLYRHEFEEDHRPGTPAQGAMAVAPASGGDDFGHGDTMAVDRSRQHAGPAPQPTMTMTPVRESPRNATPRPRGVVDEGGAARTEEFTARPSTERMPTYRSGSGKVSRASVSRPGTVVREPLAAPPPKRGTGKAEQYRPPSRRLEPVVVAEPSVIGPRTDEPSVSVSQTEPAAPDELPVELPKSRAPLVVAGTALLLLTATAATYFFTRSTPSEPEIQVAQPDEGSGGPVVPSGGPEKPPPERPVVLPPAPEPTLTGKADEDAGSPAVEEVVEAHAPPPAPKEPSPRVVDGPPAGDSGGSGGSHTPESSKKRLTGTLVVKAKPFAEVYEGSRLLNEVQGVGTFTLTAGTHDLRFVHRQKSERRRVTIKAGQTTTEIFDATQ